MNRMYIYVYMSILHVYKYIHMLLYLCNYIEAGGKNVDRSKCR